MTRLFIALWPDDRLREAIAAWQREWRWDRIAAPVRTERLHITLHFLGDIAAQRVPQLARRLGVPWEPFELALGHAEIWPNGVAALRPHDVPAPLRRLHQLLAHELEALAVPLDERPYKPHVTVARRAYRSKPPERDLDVRWRVDSGYVLVRSLPGGAGYQVLERFCRRYPRG